MNRGVGAGAKCRGTIKGYQKNKTKEQKNTSFTSCIYTIYYFNMKGNGREIFKDKSYSIRLNSELVKEVKELTGESPQNMVDSAYEQYMYLLEEIKEKKLLEEL